MRRFHRAKLSQLPLQAWFGEFARGLSFLNKTNSGVVGFGVHKLQSRCPFARRNKALRAPGDGQLFAVQQFANLPARMVGPGAAFVQPRVRLPVAQRRPRLALALMGRARL